MKPSVTSTLIAVRLVLNQQGVHRPEIPVSQYMISIGGAQAFSAFGEGNEKPSVQFAEMLDGVDFAYRWGTSNPFLHNSHVVMLPFSKGGRDFFRKFWPCRATWGFLPMAGCYWNMAD